MFIPLILIWFILLSALIVFSYTQIDLNLTFLNWEPYLNIQQSLIHLGYFQRKTNVWFFVGIFTSLTALYVYTVYLISKSKLSSKQLVILIFMVSVISFFSYNAFSRDIFNYMFDARIFTLYGLNPYDYKPLDFPQDEWTRFMHWTHRTYPYGPVWLVLTVIPSFLGFGKFLITYLLFKLIFVISYLVICRYIFRIFNEVNITKLPGFMPLAAAASFALNPLVIINGLTSPHLDITMAAFMVAGLYYLLKQKSTPSLAFLLLSIGIKYATITLLPLFNVYAVKVLGYKFWIFGLVALSFIGSIIIQSYGRGLQIWYYLLPLSLLPLLLYFVKLKWVMLLNLLVYLYLGAYITFILTGEW